MSAVKKTSTILLVEHLNINEALPNGNFKITGEAIHPCFTHHPAEWLSLRQYVEPFLVRAAPTLANQPWVIDHGEALPFANKITKSYWDSTKSAVVFEGQITPEVKRMFDEGMLIKKVSVGIDWMQPGGGIIVGEQGQVIPYGFDFTELSFISRTHQPGDPATTLNIWESIMTEISKSCIDTTNCKEGDKMNKEMTEQELKDKIKETVKATLEENKPEELTPEKIMESISEKLGEFFKDALEARDNEKALTEARKRAEAYPSKVKEAALAFLEKKEDHEPELEEATKLMNESWTTEYIGKLPIEAYAVSEAKDEEHFDFFAHHDMAEDKVGAPNKKYTLEALAEAIGLKEDNLPEHLSPDKLKEAIEHLKAHAKEESWESEIAGITKESMLVEARKQIADFKDKAKVAESAKEEAERTSKENLAKVVDLLENVVPQVRWTMGHKLPSGYTKLIEDVKGVTKKVKEMAA